MDLIQTACRATNADLSPWGELLEIYGIFSDGKATPERQNVKMDATLMVREMFAAYESLWFEYVTFSSVDTFFYMYFCSTLNEPLLPLVDTQ